MEGWSYKGQGNDLGVCAGREILQLITNQLSIAQWAQTLSKVRKNVNVSVEGHRLQPKAAPALAQPRCSFLQTNKEMRSIVPETFVHCVDMRRRKV